MINLFKITDIFLVITFASAGVFSGMKLTELYPSSPASARDEKDHPSPVGRAPSLTRNTTYILSPYSSRGRFSPRMNGIVKKLLAGKYPKNWEQELDNILERPLSEDGVLEALFIFFSKWAEQDLQNAWDHAGKTGFDPFIFRSEIFSQLAEKDAKSALAFYKENEDLLEQERSDLISIIANHWAMQDPYEALMWGLSLKKEADDALLTLIMSTIGLKSDRVTEFMDTIYSHRGYLPNQLFIEWLALAPDEALVWSEKIRNQQPGYTESVLEGVARNDLSRAINLFNELPTSEQDRFEDIIHNHIFPPEKLPFVLIIGGDWTYSDSIEAEAWIRRLNSPSIKDTAIKRYAKSIPASQSYENVVNFINEISSTAETRKEAMQTAIEKWKEDNPDKFHIWLEKSGNQELKQLSTQSDHP